ncbi:hypothetical protein E3E29_11005, partial [Thermococcus sp. Bubb.Bath]|nr:hypothetical protein [Thermococcus sp. Bubb.Bath]
MNKRRKAQVFSLMLALLMLASVVPGTFLKPVAAAGYITGVSAETNYGDSVLFNGFNYYVNITVNASQNTFANITLYYIYNDGHNETVYNNIKPIYSGSNTIIINSTSDIPSQYSKIPQDVSAVKLIVYEAEWDSSISNYVNVGPANPFNFNVKFPFTVTYQISTQSNWTAGYINGSNTYYDQPMQGFPFDINVTIQYNSTLVNSSDITLPDPSNLSVVLQNQSPVEWDFTGTAINLGNGNVQLPFDSADSNTSAGEYVFTGNGLVALHLLDYWNRSNITEKVIVTDNQNSLVNSKHEFHIWQIFVNLTNVTYTNDNLGHLYKNIPFNLTAAAQVYVNISGTPYKFTSPDTVYFHQFYIVDGNGHVLGQYGYSSAVLNSTGGIQHTFTNLVTDADYVNVTTWKDSSWHYTQLYDSLTGSSPGYWPNYPPDVVQVPVQSWNITITPTITCAGHACTNFAVGVNQTLNISVHYPIEPYYVNSTANYSILLNGVEKYHGNMTITNNTGSVAIPVNFNETGTVVIKVWDNTYHPEPSISTALNVSDWVIGRSYQVIEYPDAYNIVKNKFYLGVPANLSMTIGYTEPCPVNSTLSVTLTAPDGTVYGPYEFPVSNANSTSFTLPETFNFTEAGYVTVNVTDEASGKKTSLPIPVQDWNIQGNYTVLHYGTYPDRVFYIGIPANLNLTAVFTELRDEGIPLNSTLHVTVYGPDMSVAYTGNLPVVNDSGSIVTPTLQFNQIGEVTVVFNDTTYNKTYTLTIPVRDWGIYVDTTPDELVVGNSTPLTVNIRESLYFMGTKDVNVTLYLPDETEKSRIVTLQGSNNYAANGGYYGVMTFTNVTPTAPGIARLVVTDISSGKTAVKLIPVYPARGRIYLETTVNPAQVYQYMSATATLKIMNYTGPAPATLNVTVYYPYPNSTEYFQTQVTYTGNVPVVTVPIPTGQLGNVTIEVMDEDGNYMGIAKIPVNEWQVNFNWNVPTVYKWVASSGSVSISTVPEEPVTVVLKNGTDTIYNGSNLEVPFNIPAADSPVTYTAEVYYNGHLVGSDSYTVTPEDWGASLSLVDSEVYQYIGGDVTIGVHVTGPSVPVVVNFTGDAYTNGETFTYHVGPGVTEIPYELTYNGHVVGTGVIDVPVQSWSVSITPSRTWAYKYVPTEISFTVTPNVTAVNPHDLVVKVDGVETSIINVALTGDETHTVEVYYNGHLIKSENITIHAVEWSAELEYTLNPNVAYVDVPTTLTAEAQPGAPVDVNVSIIQGGAVIGSGLNEATASVDTSSAGMLTYTLRAIYDGHVVGERNITVPVNDWSMFVDTYPEELRQDETVNFTVHVTDSRYFSAPVNVKLILPSGVELTQNGSLSAGEGTVVFTDVTPSRPGIAWVIVTDELSGKTFKAPVKVNAAIIPGNKWIAVTAAPASEPVYAYLNNSLRIDVQYMYSDGIATYKDTDDHVVNITIIGADGNEHFLQLPVDNGFVEIPKYEIPVNGTGDIAISVVDAYNSSITGGAVVKVTSWDVSFDFATNGTVYKYVDNMLYVTVHVNGPSVPVNVSINGN